MSASAAGVRFVTDGGLETDLIFHHGVELPDFAAFVLLGDARGRGLLEDYYRGYADIARSHDVGLRLESATWRASTDWGEHLGYDAAALDRANAAAVGVLRDVADDYRDLPAIRLIGTLGPRGDGYRSGAWDAESGTEDAFAYHRTQVDFLADAGVDAIAAYTSPMSRRPSASSGPPERPTSRSRSRSRSRSTASSRQDARSPKRSVSWTPKPRRTAIS